MRFSRVTIALAAVAVLLVGTIGVQEHQKTKLRSEMTAVAFSRDSVTAKNDTTRRAALENAKVAKVLGDSLQLYQQRIVQTAQHQDAIDKALKQERVGRYAMVAKIDSLTAAANARGGTVEDTSSRVRRASFAIRQAPYTLTAAVELPPPPDTGRLAARISLDQIQLVARLSCGAPNTEGIRPASIETTAPPWASVKFTDVEQSPDLCRSPALKPKRSWLAFRPLMFGGGRVTTPDGHSAWGAFVGSGFAIGG